MAASTPIPRIRTALLCVEDGRLLCVELEDPTTRKRFWSVPGGEVEPGEEAIAAAVRETLEETGYTVTAIAASERVTRYDFRWNAKSYQCQTHWFLGRLARVQAAPVDDADYLVGCDWIPLARLSPLLAYHPHIRGTVLAMLAGANQISSPG